MSSAVAPLKARQISVCCLAGADKRVEAEKPAIEKTDIGGPVMEGLREIVAEIRE